MPIYEYRTVDHKDSCRFCRESFEVLESVGAQSTSECPACKNPVRRIISAPAIGASESSADDRAKSAGFTKLRKISQGEYEKEY